MKPLASNSFKGAEFVRNVFAIQPPPGVTLEDIKKREYWTNVAASLKPMARIEVLPRDGKFFAELIVTATGKNWANVVVRDYVELGTPQAPVTSDKYHIFHQGGNDAWAVTRVSDKVVLANGFDSNEEAVKWMEAYDEPKPKE